MNNQKLVSVMFACAIGAGLGTLMALQFGAFWVLGLITGALCGYIIYDFKGFVKTIPEAYIYARTNFKPLTATKQIVVSVVKAILLLVAIIGIPISTLLLCSLFYQQTSSEMTVFSSLVIISFLFLAVLNGFVNGNILGSAYMSEEGFKLKMTNWKESYSGWFLKNSRKSKLVMVLFLLFSGIISVFLCLVIAVIVAKEVFEILLHVGRFLLVFLWKLFKLIHSDLRLLVGIDSLLGGCIGFVYENIFLGMFLGAILGGLNYYVVSIKILKLKPRH